MVKINLLEPKIGVLAFCSECYWIEVAPGISSEYLECNNPNNLTLLAHYQHKKYTSHARNPNRINHDSACSWFRWLRPKETP